MDLRFYSGDGRLIFICADYVKVSWQDCLKDEGISEIVLLKSHSLFDIIIKNPVLIVSYGKSQGIVCGYMLEEDLLKITVKSLLTLLKRRILMADAQTDEITFSGNPLQIIRDEILKFVPYITFSGEVSEIFERTVTVKTGENLLAVCKQLLDGTGVGINISFSPENACYTLSFIYPDELVMRFSSGNRNLSDPVCSSDFSAVKNSGYYTAAFSPPVEWDPSDKPNAVKNNDPKNFMKQYILLSPVTIDGQYINSGLFLYSDTKDGALKISDTEKTESIQYISLEENPVLVFEEDLRKYELNEASGLLEIRKHISELWDVNPVTDTNFALGSVLSVEKEAGIEKGIKKMQVISVKTDTEKSLPEIELA